MNKILSLMLCAGLMFSAQPACSQIKSTVKALRNLSNLGRALAHAAEKSRPRIRAVSKLVASQAFHATHKTVVGQSYARYARRHFSDVSAELTPVKISQKWLEQPGEKTFYTDLSVLARDLNAFYEGDTDVLISPDGREVKLYMLPVSGILYQPAGYKEPIYLNADDYFLVYDINKHTGQLVENAFFVYETFRPRVYDEIWKGMGASKEFDDLNNLCDAILLAHLHKARVETLRAAGATEDTKTLVKEGRSKVWQQLNNQPDVMDYLQRMPKYRHAENSLVLYTLDLPVEGLVWVDKEGVRHEYTIQDYAMVFFEMGAVGIFPRADLEDPRQFVPVSK